MTEADLESLWSAVLSGDLDRLHRAMDGLGAGARFHVMEHLQQMATEAGWQPVQRSNARRALELLRTESAPSAPKGPSEPRSPG